MSEYFLSKLNFVNSTAYDYCAGKLIGFGTFMYICKELNNNHEQVLEIRPSFQLLSAGCLYIYQSQNASER